MSKRDLIGIIAKNISMAAADSITTAVVTGESSYALGGLASATGKTIEEVKQHLKDSNDGLYHLHVKTFFETADIDPEQFEQFIKDNPNEVKLGAEFLKILEKTLLEDQAKMYARAFSLYVKGKITEAEMNKYVYIIGKFDRHLMNELSKLKGFKPRESHVLQAINNKLITDNFIKNVNEELMNFNFVERVTNLISTDGILYYSVTPFYQKFEEQILKE